jgi:hypothetical protein
MVAIQTIIRSKKALPALKQLVKRERESNSYGHKIKDGVLRAIQDIKKFGD